MKIKTTRSEILNVVQRWVEQYPTSNEAKTARLRQLDLETATATDVAAIIGNDTWTSLKCDECQADVSCVIEIGEPPDYESHTVEVCVACLSKAMALAAEERITIP